MPPPQGRDAGGGGVLSEEKARDVMGALQRIGEGGRPSDASAPVATVGAEISTGSQLGAAAQPPPGQGSVSRPSTPGRRHSDSVPQASTTMLRTGHPAGNGRESWSPPPSLSRSISPAPSRVAQHFDTRQRSVSPAPSMIQGQMTRPLTPTRRMGSEHPSSPLGESKRGRGRADDSWSPPPTGRTGNRSGRTTPVAGTPRAGTPRRPSTQALMNVTLS